MFDKLLNSADYIFGGILVLLVAVLCYGLGSQAKTNKICEQVGGMYVQTWSDGYKCVMLTEITLK
jgi:hypothetical protein